MTARSCRSVLGAATLVLGVAASAVAAPAAVPAALVSISSQPTIQPVAMGDLPTVPRRRGGRRAQAKDKPYQPLSKDPAGESATAHKDYLKRYGF